MTTLSPTPLTQGEINRLVSQIDAADQRRPSFKQDFMARHAEALEQRRPMSPPAVRVRMMHEQENG